MRLTTPRCFTGIAAAAAFSVSSLLLAPPTLAGDFQAKRVAADAKWLAFIDIQGLLKSDLGKFFTEHGGDLGLEIESGDMKEIEAELGINPLEDVRSITVYGEGNPEEQMHLVALLETSAAIDDAIAKLSGAAPAEKAAEDDDADDDAEAHDITIVELNGQKVHVISDGETTTYLQVRPGPTSADRLVIVSMDREWMTKGLAVLDGKSPSLSGASKPALSVKPADGTLAFAICNDLGWIDIDEGEHEPASAILKGAKGVSMAYGESAGDMFVNLRLDTGSNEDAQNLGDIARGLVAMARLAGSKEPAMQPLMGPMRSLELKTEGSGIILNLTHNTAELIKAFSAMAEVSKALGDDDDEDVDIDNDDDEDEDEDTEKVEIKAHVKVNDKSGNEKD